METEGKTKIGPSKTSHFLQKIAELSAATFNKPCQRYNEIVKTVAHLLNAKLVCISEIHGSQLYFKSLFIDGEIKENAGQCSLDVTPCATVSESKEIQVHDEAGKKFPQASLLHFINAGTYCGVPCFDSRSQVKAVLCIVDDKKRSFKNEDMALVKIVGSMIGIEMERQNYCSQKNYAEKELHEKDKKYLTLIQTANDAIMTIDIKVGLILEANRKAEKMMGRMSDEIIGRHMDELYSHENCDGYQKVFNETLEKGSAISEELSLLHVSGKKIPVEVSTNISTLNDNDVIQCIFRDLTERKKAEKEVRESLRLFENVISVSPAIVYQCRIEKNRFIPVYVSNNMKALWGYDSHEYLNNPDWWFNHIYPEDRDSILSLFPYKLYRDNEQKHEYRFRDKEGNYRWVYDYVRLIRNKEGEPHEVVGSWLDITERKQIDEELSKYREYLEFLVDKRTGALRIINEKLADEIEERKGIEKALRESEERYRLFVEEFHGITFQGRIGGGIIFLHGAVEEISGYKPEELINGTPRLGHIFYPDDRDRFYEGYNELRTICDYRVRREYRIIRKDGEIRWVEEIIQNICDEKGIPSKVQGTICDITDQKRAEEELEKAKREAESANLAKSAFIANVSHEIRTPMQTILGMSEALEGIVAREEGGDYVKSIISAGDNVLRLINNILDFSRIESGKFELEEIDFDLYEVIEGASEIVAFQARQKRLFFHQSIDKDIPAGLRGDPLRLRQVLINLLSNAVKFTAKGGVSLTVEKKEEKPDILTLLFSVKDTGIGVQGDKLAAIFQGYTQGDRSVSRLYGGTGLGTSISKELVEMMGGKIGVESRKGEGSRFYFTVPFKVQKATPEEAESGL
ncbi:MAG: PAS domain S-box protein [Deltaproteobacteria bacterium]|nr:PAS domain S-box protein [Deltaproteobacteria bacterium]